MFERWHLEREDDLIEHPREVLKPRRGRMLANKQAEEIKETEPLPGFVVSQETQDLNSGSGRRS